MMNELMFHQDQSLDKFLLVLDNVMMVIRIFPLTEKQNIQLQLQFVVFFSFYFLFQFDYF